MVFFKLSLTLLNFNGTYFTEVIYQGLIPSLNVTLKLKLVSLEGPTGHMNALLYHVVSRKFQPLSIKTNAICLLRT